MTLAQLARNPIPMTKGERQDATVVVAAIFAIAGMQSVALVTGSNGDWYMYSLVAIAALGGLKIGQWAEKRSAYWSGRRGRPPGGRRPGRNERER